MGAIHTCFTENVSGGKLRFISSKMAKSLRSKRKRKFRALKREKNAPRELAKLKQVLALHKDVIQDEEMKDLVTVTDAKKIQEDKAKKAEGMDVDSKTLKDKDGQYPEWMNQRQIGKKKAQVKRAAK